MDFPLPLPAFCRGYGKRKWEVAGAQRVPYKFSGIVMWRLAEAGRKSGLSGVAIRERRGSIRRGI